MEHRNRKQKRATEASLTAEQQRQQPAKRRTPSLRSRFRPEFWDNLSRVPLCRRALREFNRRAVQPAISKPPAQSVLQDDLVKQLKRFARHGGPNLRDIRGYPERVNMSLPYSYLGTGIGSTRRPRRTPGTTASAKVAAFRDVLIAGRIYPPKYEYPGDDKAPIFSNLDKVMRVVEQRRSSLSASQFGPEHFQNLIKANNGVESESEVMTDVFPIIRGKETMPRGQNYFFNYLKPLAPNISDPKPDYFNGSHPTQINTNILKKLGEYITPCNYKQSPALPNFFMEAKAPRGDAVEAALQITQDLAAGARGIYMMQSYGLKDPVYDGNAYAFGSIYHSGADTLQLYAMHPTKPAEPNGEPKYHTTKLRGFDLTNNLESCRQGIAAWRNLRDMAKEYRDEIIARANEVAVDEGEPEAAGSDAHPTSLTANQFTQNQFFVSDTIHEESETSMDELAPPAPPIKRTRRRQSSRKRRKVGQSVIEEEDEEV
ncbi:hypothetical protein CC80DRAFT_462403 [Byssothecium circinans]|uniref:DUF7924 domain-containing protein n=1 Tax=Byssothecium circinans TaxID=147558 RepID=A0A6A5UC77_9PLEO|nr:hypothetical protein CC80DRAFT_462403 [Byssothecium circinans]